jgi:NTP pyrophosphatase (non-canonical NTP hydrolase)
MHKLTFQEAIELYRSIYQRFEKIEGRPWGVEGALIELSKQVGELAKYVMVAEKYYYPDRANKPEYHTTRDGIGDELADIFAAVIRIADYYDIDFVDAHINARQEEDEWLTQKGV